MQSKPISVIFVHGILSSSTVWKSLESALANEPTVAEAHTACHFEYPASLVELSPISRLPDIDKLGVALQTFIDTEVPRQSLAILVGHSQGGLVIQRYLANQILEKNARNLERFKSVTLLATPNAGSEFLLSLRKQLGLLLKDPQEKDIRPLSEGIMRAQRIILERVVFASGSGESYCKIPVYAYAGESDSVVQPASARMVFPQGGVLPGDHSSILAISSPQDTLCQILAERIIEAKGDRQPSLELVDALGTPAGTTKGVFEPSTTSVGASSPNPHSGARTVIDLAGLSKIADALICIDELTDSQARGQILSFIPPNIRGSMSGAGSTRTQLISLVRACIHAGDPGRVALLDMLAFAFSAGDTAVQHARRTIEDCWPEAQPCP